jgi:hypothetical protein
LGFAADLAIELCQDQESTLSGHSKSEPVTRRNRVAKKALILARTSSTEDGEREMVPVLIDINPEADDLQHTTMLLLLVFVQATNGFPK